MELVFTAAGDAQAGTDPSCGSPQIAGKSLVQGFWYRNPRDGVDDGREGLQAPLSALCDSATDQSMMPFERR